MARKKSSYRAMKKIEPAAQTLTFRIPAALSGLENRFVDLSQCASLVNRRFYRQGINWAVSSIKIASQDFAGTITVSKLPETWVMSNAWEKGFRVWQRMNNEALRESESVRPRFLDFKVYANADHHAAGFAANLLPESFAGTAVAGEWAPSKVHIPSSSPGYLAADREMIAVGASYPGNGASGFNAVSLIEGYAASRALPNIEDPNTPDDMRDADGAAPENWQVALFNDGTQQESDVLDDMSRDNNIAPYPFENDGVNNDTMYPNGANQLTGLQVHDIEFQTTTTIGGITRIKGGMFPCGLMALQFEADAGPVPDIIMQVDLVPGNHRGYLCEPMTEM